MIERDLDKEFELLDKIFQRNPNQKVQLLLFDIQMTEKEYLISDGNWKELKQILLNCRADGATIYSGLEQRIKNETVYFFTDGNSLVSDGLLPIKKGNFIINTVPNRNFKFLERSALIGKGRLLDLAAILPENISKTGSSKEEAAQAISGTVYIDYQPSNNTEIRVKGSNKIFKTNEDGHFNIPAIAGDSLLITSRAAKSMKIVPIGYFTSNVDVFLESNVTTLDEVVVTVKRIASANVELQDTATGLKNKESLGYAVQSIGDDEIAPIQTDLSQSVQGKFSNVNIKSDRELTQFTTRPNNTLLGNNYGLIVVDGIPMEMSDSSSGRPKPSDANFNGSRADASFIDPENIAKITVLKGFAATNRYGALGNGGVLLITTKNAGQGKGKEKLENTALIKNNIYDSNSERKEVKSAFQKDLEGTGTLEEAYENYLTLRNFNGEDNGFYLDAFDFFKDKDKNIAAKIISNLWELNPTEESYIKATELAIRFLELEETATELNQELNKLRPLAIQPFFEEAKIELSKGNEQKALNLLTVLANGGSNGSLKTSTIKKSLDRELKNLIFRKKSILDIANVKEEYFKNAQMNVRILMEWSNPKAEFQIQFVNPQNRFFNWEHTTEAGAKRIQEEVQLGYTMEEFELYDDLKGEWTINANYLGNLDVANNEPLVLLCTIYTNFGYPSQTQQKVFLHLSNEIPKKKIISLKI